MRDVYPILVRCCTVYPRSTSARGGCGGARQQDAVPAGCHRRM